MRLAVDREVTMGPTEENLALVRRMSFFWEPHMAVPVIQWLRSQQVGGAFCMLAFFVRLAEVACGSFLAVSPSMLGGINALGSSWRLACISHLLPFTAEAISTEFLQVAFAQYKADVPCCTAPEGASSDRRHLEKPLAFGLCITCCCSCWKRVAPTLC